MPQNTPFLDNLKRQAEENPVVALGVGAALITAISKLVTASSNSRNSKVWAQEVERRVQQAALDKKK
jgi:hypothetical protein